MRGSVLKLAAGHTRDGVVGRRTNVAGAVPVSGLVMGRPVAHCGSDTTPPRTRWSEQRCGASQDSCSPRRQRVPAGCRTAAGKMPSDDRRDAGRFPARHPTDGDRLPRVSWQAAGRILAKDRTAGRCWQELTGAGRSWQILTGPRAKRGISASSRSDRIVFPLRSAVVTQARQAERCMNQLRRVLGMSIHQPWHLSG